MPNPYDLLGVSPESDDEEIRRAYLRRVEERPPERYPDEFDALRAAYGKIATLRDRLDFFLFDPATGETLDEIIDDVRAVLATRRPRWTLSRIRETITKV